MSAYYIGLKTNTALATTMAFATLTIARLFHGFNCRGKESIRKLKLKTNPYQIMAFVAGITFILIVLFVPQLHGLFEIADFTAVNILEILGIAFVPTLIIQIVKEIQAFGRVVLPTPRLKILTKARSRCLQLVAVLRSYGSFATLPSKDRRLQSTFYQNFQPWGEIQQCKKRVKILLVKQRKKGILLLVQKVCLFRSCRKTFGRKQQADSRNFAIDDGAK